MAEAPPDVSNKEPLKADMPKQIVVPGEIEEIIKGVKSQSELLCRSKAPDERAARCAELLSRVRSLLSCCEAAGLGNTARQARALQSLLDQLCKERHKFSDTALNIIAHAVEILAALSG